jgi:hypothetical protein
MRIRRLTPTALVAVALLATAVVCAPASSAITVVNGPTVQAPVTPGPDQVTTVVTIDSTTGQVVTEWTGPESQNAAVVAQQRAAAGISAPASPPSLGSGGFAPQIARHSPCTAGTGYFEVWNYPPLVCFANSGAMTVSIATVYEVDTGNNIGGVHFTCGGSTCNTGYFPKWSTILFNTPFPTVNYVYIQ